LYGQTVSLAHFVPSARAVDRRHSAPGDDADARRRAERRDASRGPCARPRDAETAGEGAREGRAREDARGAIGRATEGRDAGRGARRAARDVRRR
jgi:hypothetical protein